MKRKILLVLILFLSLGLIGCNTNNPDPNPNGDDNPPIEKPKDDIDLSFSYYATTKLRDDSKIYVLNSSSINEKYDNDEIFLAQAIQGLFARKEVTFYVDGRSVTNQINTDNYYLEQAAEKYGLELEYITLDEAIAMYLDSWDANVESGLWGSQLDLNSFNSIAGIKAYTEKDEQGFKTPGYIVYRKGEVSVNVAATLSGLTGFLPVEMNSVERYQALGLVEKFNVDNIALGYQWLFNAALSEINPDGLVHQNYTAGGGETNRFIKDYGICNKYMYVYYDSIVNASNKFKQNLHRFLTPNRPIFGYTYSEDSDVAFFSQYGQFIVPTDYTYNLTFFASKEFHQQKQFKQPNNDKDIVANNKKHYVAFVVSDGDNATYWQNTAGFSSNYMNAVGRENDKFAVTWSISPSLTDLMPNVLDNVYHTVATPYDYFCAPVSGQGYINAGSFASQNNGEYFDEFTDKLDVYMAKSNLSVVTIIGGNHGDNLDKVLKGYASAEHVKGGLVYEGSKYFGAVRGGVYWVDGKPFVGPRDSLWETTPEYIAARLNMYEKDPTTINGYSIINVHPWSHSYEDIRTIVNLLDDSVEVVSLDALIKLMTDNIIDKADSNSFTIPEKNGISITQSYLEDNPQLIPVNPLFNDFLLWQEDWTGSGLTYANRDDAMSNVGAIYKGSIMIAPGSTATKNAFTLPNQDNLWVSFSARANATNESLTSTFKFSLNIDGVSKVIIDQATLKGVRGTQTQTVYGDGWQIFAFPIAQYFENYQGKQATVSVEVLSGVDLKLDQFEVTHRALTNTLPYDSYNNEFENENTEDFMLGHIYKTSQYFHWGAFDRSSLKNTGTIQVDCSDGGGDEKRNGNTNLWMAKTYQLPESDNITLSFKFTGGGDAGAMSKVSMYINGHYLVLQDWERHVDANTYEINLQSQFPDIDFNNQTVTIIIEARDSGRYNGVGESWDLHYFKTTFN